MGSYTDLEIAGYPVWTQKSYVDPVIMTLFRETDKRIYKRRVSERNPLVWGVLKNKKLETAYEYSIETGLAAHRLDVMGFTLKKAKEQFEQDVSRIKDKTEAESENSKESAFLSKYTFNKWAKTFRALMEAGITRWHEGHGDGLEAAPLIRFIFDEHEEEFYLGFPISDVRYFIRAALALVDPGEKLVLDLTELIHAGYYDGSEQLTKIAGAEFSSAYIASSTIIVLTEGSSDANALRQTLSLLYPHLTEFYSFLDFGTSNMQGGAANLVGIIKAFIGSGVLNKVVAVFDNDTAARDAMRGLKGLNIPENIRIMQYPPIPYANRYPTIGPQGIKKMNVNGLAGGLELYFGQDVLAGSDGKLSPVQWKGYNSTLGQYQGEITNKGAAQSAYLMKLQRCASGTDALGAHDWSAMRRIFESIFKAFS
jgi:hypothetical protein